MVFVHKVGSCFDERNLGCVLWSCEIYDAIRCNKSEESIVDIIFVSFYIFIFYEFCVAPYFNLNLCNCIVYRTSFHIILTRLRIIKFCFI